MTVVGFSGAGFASELPDCEHLHTPNQPDNQPRWHQWAEEMSKTHRQERCPGCGLYQIWVPKLPKVKAES